MILTYSVRSNVDYPLHSLQEFIGNVLHSEKGITSLFGNLEFVFVDNNDANINFILSENNDIVNICNFNGLSCADRLDGNVYINFDNWISGSQVFYEGLDDKSNWLDLYRTYLINHECMHILGFNHPPKNMTFDDYSSVMAQQTVNLQGGRSWWWPVKSDVRFFKIYKLM